MVNCIPSPPRDSRPHLCVNSATTCEGSEVHRTTVRMASGRRKERQVFHNRNLWVSTAHSGAVALHVAADQHLDDHSGEREHHPLGTLGSTESYAELHGAFRWRPPPPGTCGPSWCFRSPQQSRTFVDEQPLRGQVADDERPAAGHRRVANEA